MWTCLINVPGCGSGTLCIGCSPWFLPEMHYSSFFITLCVFVPMCRYMQGRKNQHTLNFPLCIHVSSLQKRAKDLWFSIALNYRNYHSNRALCVFLCVCVNKQSKGRSTHASWTALELFMSCHNVFSTTQHTNNWNNDVKDSRMHTHINTGVMHAHTHREPVQPKGLTVM